MNLRWSWDERTRDLFRWVDPERGTPRTHDPVRLLGLVPPERLEALANDRGLPRLPGRDRRRAGPLPRRCPAGSRAATDSPLRLVGYFSPEFGISEALPQYSGGLGVLAGDHLKAASDLGVPLVGVGLFYRHGYFRQSLNLDGWQQERYPELDPYAMALRAVRRRHGHRRPGRRDRAPARSGGPTSGASPLYLLDTDVEANPPELRAVTDRLYGGDTEHRLRQEIVLGVGGVRALQALGHDAQVFHTNEGHAGFLGLERIRQLVHDGPHASPRRSRRSGPGASSPPTRPVPAGIDRFPRELMEKYFDGFADELRRHLRRPHGARPRATTSPTRPASTWRSWACAWPADNGVAKLHGEVSREMFAALWPDVPVDEVPIASITNGVHAPTWVAPEIDDAAVARTCCPTGSDADDADWARVGDVRDDELWRAKEQGRERLVTLRPRAPARGQAGPGRERERRRLVRRRCSTRRCSPSASPAASPPTSGPRCCSRSPSG